MLAILLSDEQVSQIIHYGKTKSITTACNVTQSLVDKIMRYKEIYMKYEPSCKDQNLKKLEEK